MTDGTKYPGELCHVCGSPKTAYNHTISPIDKPYIMINVQYCKRCAELLDKFEQDLYKWVSGTAIRDEDLPKVAAWLERDDPDETLGDALHMGATE